MSQIPYVKEGKLHQPDGRIICPVPATRGRTGWVDWLEGHKSFRFHGLAGTHCTVIKEIRRGKSGLEHDYWFAHRHVLGKLRRVYLGKSARLNLTLLEAAAARLAQLEMDGGGAP